VIVGTRCGHVSKTPGRTNQATTACLIWLADASMTAESWPHRYGGRGRTVAAPRRRPRITYATRSRVTVEKRSADAGERAA